MLKTRKALLTACLIVILCGSLRESAVAQEKKSVPQNEWAATIYFARMTSNVFADYLRFKANFEDSYLLALALSKNIYSYKKYFDFELEGQIVKHYLEQNHMEFNGMIVISWNLFPWDNTINTSFTVGEGFSWATKIPVIEARLRKNSSRFLDYVKFEFEFSLPREPDWSLIAIIHHRSGIHGLIKGIHVASNALGLGLRHRFKTLVLD